ARGVPQHPESGCGMSGSRRPRERLSSFTLERRHSADAPAVRRTALAILGLVAGAALVALGSFVVEPKKPPTVTGHDDRPLDIRSSRDARNDKADSADDHQNGA